MYIDFLIDVFNRWSSNEALVWRNQSVSCRELGEAVETWRHWLHEKHIPRGSVVSLEADFSPNSVALMLALIEEASIVVPLTESVEAKKPEFREISEVEIRIVIDANDEAQHFTTSGTTENHLLKRLKDEGRPGLVLFSSGSTGKSKAAVHDFVPLLEKFKTRRHSKRTITFLLFDHIGGVNTLLYTLSNAGCVVTLEARTPDAVCQAIEAHGVQILPTSPTFINLLLFSEAYRNYDLSSLELVTYGTEPMPESTLKQFRCVFPHVRLLQTYGLSEAGILRSKSKSSDSLWVKVGGEGFETRVVGGLLEVRAHSAMLGYLNAPSPFTEDGWFKTGDAVKVDGDYIRILGRDSDIINVGGEKVYPSEVESVLQTLDGVEDVVVSGESNPIMGQIVKATVKLTTEENLTQFKQRMYRFCRDKLPKVRIPQKVVLIDESVHGERFKKARRDVRA